MIPSLRRLGRRAVFQHDNDPKHTSKTLRVKVMDWPSMSLDLNPIEHLWGILKWKVEERKVSNIHQLRDVVMEEWKRTPVATCAALVNSMPKRVKGTVTLDLSMRNRFACCNGRDVTSRCAASFRKLKFNTKHTIYSTFLQPCSFKFVVLIQIRGHAVTYRSAVGHTVSRDANSQARVHLWDTIYV